MKSIVILISGRGSNMEALLDRVSSGELKVRVAAVLSNRPQAKGLEIAPARGIPVRAIDHKLFPQRADFDAALINAIDEYAPDLVVLAGFMRILSEDFVNHYAGRLLNIHPSLLPSFPAFRLRCGYLQLHILSVGTLYLLSLSQHSWHTPVMPYPDRKCGGPKWPALGGRYQHF